MKTYSTIKHYEFIIEAIYKTKIHWEYSVCLKSLTPSGRKWGQEDGKFKVILSYTGSLT